MKNYLILLILLSVLFQNINGQTKNKISNIILTIPDFSDTMKIRVKIWKKDPDTSSNDFKKVVDIAIIKKRTIINYPFKEAHLSNIDILKDNIDITGAAFINKGLTINMIYKCLENSFTITGDENKFYQDNQLLLFQLPAVIVNDNKYKRSTIKESYDGIIVPPMTMLSARYKEYERNIKQIVSANYNKFTIVYNLYNSRENISTKTLEECYYTLSSNLRNISYGKKLFDYIEASKKLYPGKQVPPFKATDTKMRELPINDLFKKSKTTLIHFWATWCIPCIEQMKKVSPLVQKYKEENFQVLSISLDTDYKYWQSFIKNDSIFKNQFIDTAGFKGNIAKIFGLASIPRNILVDNAGKIIAIDFDKNFIETILRKL